ncbi:MAG: hypothetical protein GTO17_04880 [Candidatus Aminicenantes bacterium]|nr:hypothetical protein [Candidatus Aminicenantes bacterium]
MRCSKARKLISEYIDDILRAKQRLLLERHLEACPDCQELLRDFRGISKKAKSLDKLTPSPRPWLNIKAKLETEPQEVLALPSPRKEWLRALFYQPQLKYAVGSALILLLVISVVTLGLWFSKRKGVIGKDDKNGYTFTKLKEAEHHYQLAIKALEEAVLAQEGEVDPLTVAVFRKNLEIINSSIISCQQALLEEPDDIETRNYLLVAYMEKVDLLNEMMNLKKRSTRKPGEQMTL